VDPIPKAHAGQIGGVADYLADDGGTSRRRPLALGATPLQRRPAAVGREDGAVDVGAVVAEQEGVSA